MVKKPASAKTSKIPVRQNRFPHHIYFESYGVRIKVESNDRSPLDHIENDLTALLAGNVRMIDGPDHDHVVSYHWNRSGNDSIYADGEPSTVRRPREYTLDQLGSQIRLTVGEYAVEKAFVHAGVVAWRGKAIVIPAKSFKGKSTLTAELVRRGALYYSDEYAVFDENGLVEPFPKMLSIRGEIDDHTQVDHPVERFGEAGRDPVPVGMILITEYKPRAQWRPKVLTKGQGVIELIRNALAIRYDPGFNLPVFDRATRDALILKTNRGEAGKFAGRLLDHFESNCL